MLSPDDFLLAGKLTQFVSIDLLVKHDDKYLLGLRTNNPAINTYFVPGSKTHKNSSLTTNFSTPFVINAITLSAELEV